MLSILIGIISSHAPGLIGLTGWMIPLRGIITPLLIITSHYKWPQVYFVFQAIAYQINPPIHFIDKASDRMLVDRPVFSASSKTV